MKFIPRMGYLVIALGVGLGALSFFRWGALSIAGGLILYIAPFFKSNWRIRRIEVIISIIIAVALITIALVLPHSNQ